MEMLPRLGKKYALEIETIAKSREAYRSIDYLASGLPAAPAIMIADEVVAQGGPIAEEALESAIRRHLGIG